MRILFVDLNHFLSIGWRSSRRTTERRAGVFCHRKDGDFSRNNEHVPISFICRICAGSFHNEGFVTRARSKQSKNVCGAVDNDFVAYE